MKERHSGYGTAYCVGTGPGDPELMTLKALRLINENKVIAVPGKDAKSSAAYRIAAAAADMSGKELLALPTPMTRDPARLAEAHRISASMIEERLRKGENVVCLVLGDPSVYSSFTYLKKILEEDGFETVMVSGVPSFCAAAARLGVSLAEGSEALHIFPFPQSGRLPAELPGTWVLMKSGRRMAEVKAALRESGRDVKAVENCGMEGERVCGALDEIPGDAGYYSLIIAKEK